MQNGSVKLGDSVAVVGAGPVGLAAMMAATVTGASRIIAVDLAASRLKRAEDFGATHTVVSGEDAEQQILELIEGHGVDVAMEAVGLPATFDLCTLHHEELWIKNITITTGLVSGSTIQTLLQLVRHGRIEPEKLGTHHFKLDEIMQAYDVFAAAGENDALKVVLTN